MAAPLVPCPLRSPLCVCLGSRTWTLETFQLCLAMTAPGSFSVPFPERELGWDATRPLRSPPQGPCLKATPLASTLDPEESACLLPVGMCGINCPLLIRLKLKCLGWKNRKGNRVSAGLRTGQVACWLMLVEGPLGAIPAVRIIVWVLFHHCVPHVSLAACCFSCLPRMVYARLVYFMGLEIP